MGSARKTISKYSALPEATLSKSPAMLMISKSKHGSILDLLPTGVTACDVGRRGKGEKNVIVEKVVSRGKASPADVGVSACVASPAEKKIEIQKKNKRKEAPPVHNHKYWNKRIATLTAANYSEMVIALKEYKDEWYSPGDTSESYV